MSIKRYLEKTLMGVPNAFNQVVVHFQNGALKYSYSILNDRGLAEDAVQDAFIIAFTKLDTLRNLDNFPGWFKAILLSCCHKLKVNKNTRYDFVEFDESRMDVGSSPTPLEVLEKNEAEAEIRSAFAGLSPKGQKICHLYYFDGYSHKEIADIMKLPLGTVKRRIHEAREVLTRNRKGRLRDEKLIRVGYLPISDHLLAMIAHQRHEKKNLKIQLRKFLSWSSLLKAISNDLLDVAFIMLPLALSLRNRGVPIKYLLDAHHDGSAITVRKDIRSLERSSKTRMGLPINASTHQMMLSHWFDQAPGSTPQGFSIKYFGPSYTSRALQKDKIDAFFCAEPWNTKSVYDGFGRILVRSRDIVPGHMCCIIVVREDFAAKKDDLVRDYVKLMLTCRDFIRARRDQSARIQEMYTGINKDIVEHVIRKKYITYDELIPDESRLENHIKMAVGAGIVEKDLNLDRFTANKDFI